MKRVVLAVALVAACKGKDKGKDEPATDDKPAAKLADAAPVALVLDAAPAAPAADCAAAGAKMGALVRPKPGAPDPDPVFGATMAAAVEVMFTAACAHDGWPAAVTRCVIDQADQGADPCLQQLDAYATVALGARLQELPVPVPPAGPMCDDAARAIGFAWALQLAKAAPSGASTKLYTELFQGLGNELEEMCTDDADTWTTAGRACLIDAHLPEELAKIDTCIATLPDEAQRQLAAFRTQVETGVATQSGPGTATGGDDCAAVGDAMVQIWTLKAQKSMAKHPATAQWDLDHLGELRALVIGACTEDKWPELVRTCITGLKLPNEASAFGDCIGGLPPETMEALGKRTAVLEAERDQAIGAEP